ncbi:MAG: hypothetical protein R2941_13915 [Desulfobacterales bacterium]
MKNKDVKRIIFFWAYLCTVCLFPMQASAGKITMEQFEVDGYEIDVSVQQKDGAIMIRGRISYGPMCSNLRITFSVENENGQKKKISETVKDAGGAGSRTIRAEKELSKKDAGRDMTWEITKVTVSCSK